ncbi:MAG TPA: branched-chain amino acid ABC transporter ATP-binding protein/permease [Candidatus Methylomirabilis sp.]|nr:branched-chain amino acid ABC transporter ATP-binding protein/permease [Candidatus Methylomirabilis sp.]
MARLGWGVLALVAVALPLLTANTYYLYVGASVALLTVVTAGLNVLVGFTGQISLGHAGFYAIGAYTAALLVMRAGIHPVAAVAAAILLAAVAGAGVAGAALRVTGPYLAMVTIAFGIIVEGLLVEWVSVTGGPGGIFNIPKLPLQRHYWIILAAAAAALWLVANLRRSAWGRAFLAVRGSEVAAESLGLSAYYVRIVAFTVSAAFAGAGGALFAFLNGYVSPDSFTLQTSILFLLALLFGGEGRVAGPVVGSLVLTLLPELLTGMADYRLILYGGLLLLSIYWLPSGVVGAVARGGAEGWGGALLPDAAGQPDVRTTGGWRGEDASSRKLLWVEDLRLSFGGVAALADVSLSVPDRGIHAVIGPNGAGKTTLLNVLSGYYVPSGGTVWLEGGSVAGRPPYAISRLGVARTFQTTQLFGGLSVLENVAVGVAGPRLGGVLPALLGTPGTRRREREVRRSALSLLGVIGLSGWADRPADAMPAGLRRKLEIVRALATRPRLLLLDEPAAGLSPREIQELDRQLTSLRDGGGPAIVLVEHHMDLVMAVSERITVLDYGRVIACGPPEVVRRHPAVVEAYLGVAT